MKKTSRSWILLRIPTRSSFFCSTGSRGLLDGHAQLGGDDPGERGLAQARRAVQQHVVHGLAGGAGSLDGDGEILLDLGLAGEVG